MTEGKTEIQKVSKNCQPKSMDNVPYIQCTEGKLQVKHKIQYRILKLFERGTYFPACCSCSGEFSCICLLLLAHIFLLHLAFFCSIIGSNPSLSIITNHDKTRSWGCSELCENGSKQILNTGNYDPSWLPTILLVRSKKR